MNKIREEHDMPAAIIEWGWKYHHLGIPTNKKMENERYLPKFKMYISGFDRSPYGVEWIRFEEGCDLPELVQNVPHLAFTVPDISIALKGKNVIIEPNSPSEGVVVAFIENDGAPIELIQEKEKTWDRDGTKEIIYSNRIFLTDMRLKDAGELFGYRALYEVYKYQSWYPENISEAEEFIIKHSVNSVGGVGIWKQYGIFLKKTGELIGDCGYCLLSETETEIGYTIAPGSQRAGFGTETVRTFIDHLFNKKGVEKIIARTDPENIPSTQLLKKFGFKLKEHLVKNVEIRGEMKDDLVFELKK